MIKQKVVITKHIVVDGIVTNYIACSDKRVISPTQNELKISEDGYYTIKVDGKRRRIKGELIDFPESPKEKKKPKNTYLTSATKNVSFTRVHEALKKAGVQNNDYMLALFDPLLEGLNPRNAALTRDIRAAIVKEITLNPWYYLREVAKIELTQEIAASIYMTLKNANVYVVTEEIAAENVYKAYAHLNAWFAIATTNNDIRVTTNNSALTRKFISNAAEIGMPWLSKAFGVSTLISNISSRILSEQTNSAIISTPIPSNATSASGIARGMTSNIVVLLNFEQIVAGMYLLQEMGPAFETKKKERTCEHSVKIILTTASQDKTYIKMLGEHVISNAIVWDDLLYDTPSHKLHELLESDSGQSKFVYFEADVPGAPARFKASPQDDLGFKIAPRSESKLQWYDNPKVIKSAHNIYDTNDFGKYENRVPERVVDEIVADGHAIPEEAYKLEEVQRLIRDYTIRNICSTIVENYPITKQDIGSTSDETLFNTFGTNSPATSSKLLTSNIISMGRYHNLLVDFMKEVRSLAEANTVGAGGLYNTEHIHTMLKTVRRK